jgi:hypothetical protein
LVQSGASWSVDAQGIAKLYQMHIIQLGTWLMRRSPAFALFLVEGSIA